MFFRARSFIVSYRNRQLSISRPLVGRAYSVMAQSSPFTKTVATSMRRLYPELLADKSFDNTGLLLEAPFQPRAPRKSNSVLLTIDLTQAVAEEAIQGNHSVIVAYHPIIFRGLKSITLNDTQQASLLRLAASGISVYSPHTAVDIVPQGMADWLCDIVTGKAGNSPAAQAPPAQTHQITLNAQKSSTASTHQKSTSHFDPVYITPPNPPWFPADILAHNRTVIISSPESSISAANNSHTPSSLHPSSKPYSTSNTGPGRLITFNNPQPLSTLIKRISESLGNPKAIQIAIPQTSNSAEDLMIKTIGLCPGSGSSVLGSAHSPPDLILTGEMSHHEALAIIERGGSLITLGHSNSERGYLNAIMREKLQQELENEWARTRQEKNPMRSHGLSSSSGQLNENENESNNREKSDDDNDKSLTEVYNDESVQVVVSKVDRDPFGIMVLKFS